VNELHKHGLLQKTFQELFVKDEDKDKGECQGPWQRLYVKEKDKGKDFTLVLKESLRTIVQIVAGASIPMGQGDTSPNIWTGGHDHKCPPNISRVISATFYPCNILW